MFGLNKVKGQFGENLAVKFLKKKGYKILETNFSTKTGEIDIIVKHKDYIVFVEVKRRLTLEKGQPSEAVGFRKQQKIINTAKGYIQKNNLYNNDFRFDVIEIVGTEINHIENAFWE
ncbi:MAG: YraN family protein [Anaerotignaceae bacterium]